MLGSIIDDCMTSAVAPGIIIIITIYIGIIIYLYSHALYAALFSVTLRPLLLVKFYFYNMFKFLVCSAYLTTGHHPTVI